MNSVVEKQRIAIAEAIAVLKASPISKFAPKANKAGLLREVMPELLELREQGYTYRQIAEQLKRSGFAITMHSLSQVVRLEVSGGATAPPLPAREIGHAGLLRVRPIID
jgi:DNA-binding NarL/FixJ family response regulator